MPKGKKGAPCLVCGRCEKTARRELEPGLFAVVCVDCVKSDYGTDHGALAEAKRRARRLRDGRA